MRGLSDEEILADVTVEQLAKAGLTVEDIRKVRAYKHERTRPTFHTWRTLARRKAPERAPFSPLRSTIERDHTRALIEDWRRANGFYRRRTHEEPLPATGNSILRTAGQEPTADRDVMDPQQHSWLTSHGLGFVSAPVTALDLPWMPVAEKEQR